jgi:hypothetical protein
MPELRVLTVDGHVDVAVGLSVVPVIIGLVLLALRLGLPPIYETQRRSRSAWRSASATYWPVSSPAARSSPRPCSVAWPSG